jgi:Raf kinase inhibitor-like YbhB/YbcL family protein
MAKSPTTGNAKQGLNDFKRLGYGGPCPPPGKPHRYFFKLYALDTLLDLKPGSSKNDLLKAMTGHLLAQGQLMGTYGR